MPSSTTRRVASVAATLALALAARPAGAQCPSGGTCDFGTDETGSSVLRATAVQSLAARNAFLARLTGARTQSFDAIADGTPAPFGVSFGAAGVATFGGSSLVLGDLEATDNGRYAVSGTHYLEAISSPENIPTFSIAFARPVTALGFFASDVGELGSQLTLRFNLVGGGTLDWALPYVATNGTDTGRDGSLLYAGFVSAERFTGVSFLGTGDDDYFALDDVTVAGPQVTATPEPAGLALLASGLGLVAAAARRRRAR